MIKDYIAGIGLDAIKDKLKDTADQKILQNKLIDFIERQRKVNLSCTLEEEIDFGGLADYIQKELMDDVQLCLFGNKKERGIARTSIINRTVSYSQKHTSLSRKRAIKLTENAIGILKGFYKGKSDRYLKLVAAQIEDAIIDATSFRLDTQTKEIINTVLSSEMRTFNKISEVTASNSKMSIATNMQLMREGKIEQIEANIANWFDAVGCTHKLFPDYCFDIKSETHQLYSRPLTHEAVQKHPPIISGTGTIKINGRYINKFDCNTVNYANRHQLPITLNIITAKKFLGDEIDPIQHEAEEMIGGTIVIPPKPFPPAFPCNISLNDEVMFEYVLFRTQEVMDDGTVIISNGEQTDCPFKIKMTANMQTQKTTYTINAVNPTNEDLVKYLRFLKCASSDAIIVINVLSNGENLARGNCGSIDYSCGFDSIDDELAFLEKIVTIERHFNEQINIPEEIYEDDYGIISYLATLIQGDECTGSWSKLEFTVPLTEELQNKIAKTEDTEFCLSYVESISATLYGKTYELPAIKIFDSVKYQNIERLKQKAEVLDVGDDIKLCFLPGDDQNTIWRDRLHIEGEMPLHTVEDGI